MMNEETPKSFIPDRVISRKGDSFDIEKSNTPSHPINQEELIIDIARNPQMILGELTDEQLENVRALIVGGTTGLGYKYLSKHLGSVVAGAACGAIAGYLVQRLLKERG